MDFQNEAIAMLIRGKRCECPITEPIAVAISPELTNAKENDARLLNATKIIVTIKNTTKPIDKLLLPFLTSGSRAPTSRSYIFSESFIVFFLLLTSMLSDTLGAQRKGCPVDGRRPGANLND